MKISKDINFKRISSFLLVILVVISLTRLWAISLFYIFGNNSEFIEKIISDRWHHYQVGIILVLLAYLLRRIQRSKLVLAIGVGIFLEEWPVFLNDLGLNTNKLYHTKFDFLFIAGIVSILYILSKGLARKYHYE